MSERNGDTGRDTQSAETLATTQRIGGAAGDGSYSEVADLICQIIGDTPIWWEAGGYPPPTPHWQHIYDDGCAICKVGHAPWAFRIVIDAVLAIAAVPIDGSPGVGS